MNESEIRTTILRALSDIAPEVVLNRVDPAVDLTEQIDIDSMDFLNFVIAIDEALGVETPERDYPYLATIDGAVAYLSRASALPA